MKILKYPSFTDSNQISLYTIVFITILFGMPRGAGSTSELILGGLFSAFFVFLIGMRYFLNQKYSGCKFRFDASIPPASYSDKTLLFKLVAATVSAGAIIVFISHNFPEQLGTTLITGLLFFYASLINDYKNTADGDESTAFSLRIFEDKLVIFKGFHVNEFSIVSIRKPEIKDGKFEFEEHFEGKITNRTFDVSPISVWHLEYFEHKIKEIISGDIPEVEGGLKAV